MARIIHERSHRLAAELVQLDDLHFAIARTIRIDTEKPFVARRDGAAISIDFAHAATGAKSNRLELRQSFDGGFGGPIGDIPKPWINQFKTFFDPALIRDRAGMRMSRGGADVGDGNTGGATGSRANLVRAFVGKDLDVDVQMDGGSGSERAAQGERRHPEIHVDSFRLFMLLRAPAPMGDPGRGINTATGGSREAGLGQGVHSKGVTRYS